MSKWTKRILFATLTAGVAIAIALHTTRILGSDIQTAKPLPAPLTPSGTNGLSPTERQTFYHLSEGAELMPLSWYLALEVETQNKNGVREARPFIENIERYGYLSDPVSPGNPYGLPVGVSLGKSKLTGTEMIGLNCAACHVGQFEYKGNAVRLDGAPNMVMINQMLEDMGTELESTIESPQRLARFWSRVHDIRAERRTVNADYDPSAPDETFMRQAWHLVTLNKDLLKAQSEVLRGMPSLNRALSMSTHEGYGRIDAFGIARDELVGSTEGNMIPPDAPVGFPHIWGMAFTGWLHWDSNTNSVIDRNIGQALGTGALRTNANASTVRLENLHALEELAYKLQPPTWPDSFPPIDMERAARGQKYFQKYCASCHEEWANDGLMRNYQLHTLNEVGTDPLSAIAFERTVLLPDGTTQPFSTASASIISKVKQQAYAEAGLTAKDIARYEQRHIRKGPQWDPAFRATLLESDQWSDTKGSRVYASKSLVGAWATAPYLHNNSVPTLFDLLHFAKDRPKKFMTGQREYDPVKLGLQIDSAKYTVPFDLKPFEFDTRVAGNWNTGHEWGFYEDLNDEMRYDIIEYIKTHNEPFPEVPKATDESLQAALDASPIALPKLQTPAVVATFSWLPYQITAIVLIAIMVILARSLMANAAKFRSQEAEDIQKICDGVLALQAAFAKEQKRPLLRGTHAKGRCFSGTFEVFDVHARIVDPTLAARLAQGIFATPGVYPATVRFANGNSKVRKDKLGDVRACSFAVELPGGARQDFSLQNATTFPINDAHAFTLLTQILNPPGPLRGFLSLNFTDKMVLLRVILLGAIQSRPAKTAYQRIRYWSTVPFSHGPVDAAKFTLIPRDGNSVRPLDGTADELLHEIIRHIADDEKMCAFDFGVQLLDTDRQRRWLRRHDRDYWIENASVPWNESQAPFHIVARLTLVRGSTFSAEASEAQYIDVTTNATPASTPLGSINRARWASEMASRKARDSNL